MMYSRINWEVIINQEMIIYQRKRGNLIMSKEMCIRDRYNPKDDIWYYACKGKGSYILEKGMVTQLRVRTFPPDEGIVVFGMPYDLSLIHIS